MTRAASLALLAALLTSCADRTPPATRTFPVNDPFIRYARFDLTQGKLPIHDHRRLDQLAASFVIVQSLQWPETPEDQFFYVADLNSPDAQGQLVAKLTPRAHVLAHSRAQHLAKVRAAGVIFLTGELAHLTPGSDRRRFSQDTRERLMRLDLREVKHTLNLDEDAPTPTDEPAPSSPEIITP
jgi:hypothetical protein